MEWPLIEPGSLSGGELNDPERFAWRYTAPRPRTGICEHDLGHAAAFRSATEAVCDVGVWSGPRARFGWVTEREVGTNKSAFGDHVPRQSAGAEQRTQRRGPARMAFLRFPRLACDLSRRDIGQAGSDMDSYDPLGLVPLAQIALHQVFDIGGRRAVLGPRKLQHLLSDGGRKAHGNTRQRGFFLDLHAANVHHNDADFKLGPRPQPLNRVPPAARLGETVKTDLATRKLPLLRASIGNRTGFATAFAAGLGVTESAPRSTAAAELRALLDELREITA